LEYLLKIMSGTICKKIVSNEELEVCRRGIKESGRKNGGNSMGERCRWAKTELSKAYHDAEWCVPLHDDQKLFEMLILEGMQAGLTWELVLKRREAMREAFDGFDPVKIAAYDEARLEELKANPKLIRNRLKLEALPVNAKAFMKVQDEYESFDEYIWQFVEGRQIINQWRDMTEMPAEDEISRRISIDLKKRGFKFVGPTICYSFMQGAGLVDDHVVDCPWHSNNKAD